MTRTITINRKVMLCTAAVLVVLVGFSGIGIHKFVQYEAREAGQTAGQEAGTTARREIGKVDVAQVQWEELLSLVAQTDLKDILRKAIHEQNITIEWLFRVIARNQANTHRNKG